MGPDGLNPTDDEFRRMTITEQQLSEYRKLQLGVLTASTKESNKNRHYFFREEYMTDKEL